MTQDEFFTLPLNSEYQNYINLAAQAAIESIQAYEEYEELALPSHELLEQQSQPPSAIKQEISESVSWSKEEEAEEEEDYIVTTYKGRFQCPRPNCSKVFCF